MIEREVAMPIAASKLPANVYRILDEVIETGKPVEILYKGVILTVEPPKRVSKLAKLKKRPGLLAGDPDDIFHIDWLKEWREEWGVTE
jgi:hypothetical protein